MKLILGADDFGRSTAINRAVEQACKAGMITSASLMVAGDAFEEAVDMARQMPSLAVGLHVVLVDGRAVLPPAAIPHLVDGERRFPRDPFRAGLGYALLSRRGREELDRELAAQFERFASTGLPLSHVDGHCHLHVHPTVFRRLLPLAKTLRRQWRPAAARPFRSGLATRPAARFADGDFSGRPGAAVPPLRSAPSP